MHSPHACPWTATQRLPAASDNTRLLHINIHMQALKGLPAWAARMHVLRAWGVLLLGWPAVPMQPAVSCTARVIALPHASSGSTENSEMPQPFHTMLSATVRALVSSMQARLSCCRRQSHICCWPTCNACGWRARLLKGGLDGMLQATSALPLMRELILGHAGCQLSLMQLLHDHTASS